MSRDNSYHDYIVYDVLGHWPAITSRPLFSGWAVYQDGVVFALIIDGQLYFKTLASDRDELAKLGSSPFSYPRAGQMATLKNYWLIPEEILEDRARLDTWLERALVASEKKKNNLVK